MSTTGDFSNHAPSDAGSTHFSAQFKVRLAKTRTETTLRRIQQRFSEAVFSTGDAGFNGQIKAGGFSGARRLQIYRNNTYSSLTESLQDTYPVVQRLVGEGFFRYAAHDYITEYPAASGDLHEFAKAFPDFLKRFEPAAQLPWLSDVARLEWLYEAVYYAAEHPPLDLNALAQIALERYGALKFVLAPASGLLASPFPVQRIWQVNQPDYPDEPTVNLDAGADWLLVLRNPALDVEIQALCAGEFTLLQSLADGHRFATACELALAEQPALDIPACLRRQVAQGALVAFLF
ncbi:MAG: DNA-binding domain-containing protein [Candidatus Competibacteraceae bacterium]